MDENSSKSHGRNPALGWVVIVVGLIILAFVLTNTIIAELFLTIGGLFGLALLFIGIDLIRPRSPKKQGSRREHQMSETNNDLYKDIENKIGSLKERMAGDKSNIKQLDSLSWLSQGVARFSHDCSECNNLQMQITNIVNDLADWPDMTDEQNDNYVKTAKGITKHLGKTIITAE